MCGKQTAAKAEGPGGKSLYNKQLVAELHGVAANYGLQNVMDLIIAFYM